MRICPQCQTRTPEALCPDDGYRTVLVRETVSDFDPLVGRVFEERYRIVEIVGRGGFGAVYRAVQLGVGREVAVKLLRADAGVDLAEVARFQQEARALAALEHPSIVQLFDFGQTDDGALYLVMELLRGRSLEAALRADGPLDAEAATNIVLQVADALGDAHAAGIVHRDLKPANLFLADDLRGRTRVKVLDFGIARVASEGGSLSLTRTGTVLGSPPYMSPEQCSGGRITNQSDVYSLGCVLYELLTGQHVFRHTTSTAHVIAHCMEEPTPPARAGEMLSGPLVDLLMTMLAKAPADRPSGMEAVAAALESMRAAPLTGHVPPGASLPHARPAPWSTTGRKRAVDVVETRRASASDTAPRARSRRWIIAAALVAAAVATALASTTRAPEPTRESLSEAAQATATATTVAPPARPAAAPLAPREAPRPTPIARSIVTPYTFATHVAALHALELNLKERVPHGGARRELVKPTRITKPKPAMKPIFVDEP